MGWAEKLPSGRYRAAYRDAHQRQRSAGTYKHKAEAVRRANAAEEDARRRAWSNPNAHKRTWGEWADSEWWPSRVVAESTAKTDKQRRASHLDPRWSQTPLGAITRHDVKAWVADLRRQGLSAETTKRCLHLLSSSLVAAVDAEVLDVNVAARIKIDSAAPPVERYLTRDEYAAIRAQMPTEHDQLIIDFLVSTGLRWGEMAGLHAARADLDRGVLRVAETWMEASGRMKGTPKGRRPREVPLTPDLARRLAQLPREGQTCGYEHTTGRCPGPLLLTTPGGSVLRNPKWAQKVWGPAVEMSGIGHVRIHDLRHTYASWLLQRGIPLAEVGRLLGHRSAATTQRYAHLAEVPSAAVLAALGASESPDRLPHESPTEPVSA